MIPVYQCPSAPKNQLVVCCIHIPGVYDAAETNYSCITTNQVRFQALAWVGEEGLGVLHGGSITEIPHIFDGSSSTLLITETDCVLGQDDPQIVDRPECASGQCFCGPQWRGNARVTTAYGINSRTTTLQSGVESYHPGGANFAFADGHVAFLSESMNQSVLAALTTYEGGGSRRCE